MKNRVKVIAIIVAITIIAISFLVGAWNFTHVMGVRHEYETTTVQNDKFFVRSLAGGKQPVVFFFQRCITCGKERAWLETMTGSQTVSVPYFNAVIRNRKPAGPQQSDGSHPTKGEPHQRP